MTQFLRRIAAFARGMTSTAGPSLAFLVLLMAFPGHAIGQTIGLGPQFALNCNDSRNNPPGCYYQVLPGTVLPVTGSGFSNSDTAVTLSGFPSDLDSTVTCPVSGGAFSCSVVVPDVPSSDSVFNGVLLGINWESDQDKDRLQLTAKGNAVGDAASLPMQILAGTGIYPTSGPPGSQVQVFGTGYFSFYKFIADTTTTITFGTDDPSGDRGTGPAVVYSNVPAQYPCVPGKDGSLSDYGPCVFTVPYYSQGTYKVGVLAAVDWSTPDVLACGSAWCVSRFTITAPTVSSVSPPESTPGSTILVTASGFAAMDTSATVAIGGEIVSSCPITASALGGSISCSVVVPSDATAPGTHHLTVTGKEYGDFAAGSFVVPGTVPLSISPDHAVPGATVTISGIAFHPSDTSVAFSSALALTPSTCNVTWGAFSCQVVLPPDAVAATYDVTARGNVAGDYDLGTLTVVGSLALDPSSGPVGTHVALSGRGLSGLSRSFSVAVNGQSVSMFFKYPDTTLGTTVWPGPTAQVTSCPVGNVGTFGLPGYPGTCYFEVPANAAAGANTVTVVPDAGTSVSTTFMLTPSISVSPTEGSIGTVISATGYGFPQLLDAGFYLSYLDGYPSGVDNSSDCAPSPTGAVSCTFAVPPVVPGGYALELCGVAPDSLQFQCVASMPFTVVPLLSPSQPGAAPGSYATAQASGFAPSDLGLVLSMNGARLDNYSCVPSFGPLTGIVSSFSCSFAVPNIPPGPYALRAAGDFAGDAATAPFTVSGISISPLSGPAGTDIDIKGYGLTQASSVTFTVGGAAPNVTFDLRNRDNTDGCSVSAGSFECDIQTPTLPGGGLAIVATGNSGEHVSTLFTVVPALNIYGPAQGAPVGAPVAMSGNGFLSSDSSVTAFFSDQLVGTCPVSNGSFYCSPLFNVPSVAPGTHVIGVHGASGSTQDTAATIFTVTAATPLVSVSGGPFTYDALPHPATCTVTGTGGASVAGTCTLTYDGSSSPPVDARTYGVAATFASSDAGYTSASGSGAITINPVSQTISFPAMAPVSFGVAPLGLNASATSALPVRFASGSTAVCTVSGATLAIVAAGDCVVSANQDGNGNYLAAVPVTQSFVVNKATPVVLWNAPSPITYGTPLSAAQLNATASVAGSFAYAPPPGTVLGAGPEQALTASFTPADAIDYAGASASVFIAVDRASTAVALSASPNPSDDRTPVAFAIAVTSPAPGAGDPAGSVQVFDGTEPLGNATLSNGQVILAAAPLSPGIHAITASYTGAGNFLPSSVGAPVVETVAAVTARGANVNETFGLGPVTVGILFSNVTSPGTTMVIPAAAASAGSLPTGYIRLPGLDMAFDVTSTATFGPQPHGHGPQNGPGHAPDAQNRPVTITFTLPTSVDAATFASLRILHNIDGQLVDQTILPPHAPAPDFATRTISASVASFSPFVVAGFPLGPRSQMQDVLNSLRSLNGAAAEGQTIRNAARHLNDALDPALWVGSSETSLQPRAGDVFDDVAASATVLIHAGDKDSTPLQVAFDALSEDLLDDLRQLAAAAIASAAQQGGSASGLAQANDLLAKGDSALLDDKPEDAAQSYRRAWTEAIRSLGH